MSKLIFDEIYKLQDKLSRKETINEKITADFYHILKNVKNWDKSDNNLQKQIKTFIDTAKNKLGLDMETAHLNNFVNYFRSAEDYLLLSEFV